MQKRPFVPAEGVSNIELFYDLIFVYCISVITSLCHHFHGDFPTIESWSIYLFSFLVVLQVWFYTTFLLNRYGDRSASDNVCLFINMFLLYFLASGIQVEWQNTVFTFNLAWALILLNLIVHWLIKRFRYDNLDDDDKKIMTGTSIVLAVQFAIVLTAAFLPEEQAAITSWVGLLFGIAVFSQLRVYRRKPSRFGHLAERCSLLVIVAFGETIVAISVYMTSAHSLLFPILVFALIVGLFLIYIYEHDNMLDHRNKTDGMFFLTLTGWLILIIGNLTVALEYMPDNGIAFVPKSVYLTVCLTLYLLTSFLFGIYNKPEFKHSLGYTVGRIGSCVAIVVVAATTNFDPLTNLVFDVIIVYFALWHEWLLFHTRTRLVSFGHALGMTYDDMQEQGYSLNTRKGTLSLLRRMKDARMGAVDEDDDEGDVEDALVDNDARISIEQANDAEN